MTIETIAFLGFVFAATTLATMAYERRMDVLYGPYLERRAGGHVRLSTERFWKPMHSAAERLRLEGPRHVLPGLRNCVLIRFSMLKAEDTATRERSRFKIVREDCDSLSIKVADPAISLNATLVRCGRCNAVRGTLDELHDLAMISLNSNRQANDHFGPPCCGVGALAEHSDEPDQQHRPCWRFAKRARSELINVLQ